MVTYSVQKPYFGKMPKTIQRDNVADCKDDVYDLARERGISIFTDVIDKGSTIDFRFHHKGSNRLFCRLERQPRPHEDLLDKLNVLRKNRGLPGLGVWIDTPENLKRALAAEEDIARARPTPKPKQLLPLMSIGRTSDGKLHYTIPITKVPAGKRRAKTTHPPQPKAKPAPRAKRVSSAAAVLIELGIDPKRGRAALRKAGVDRNDPDAIRKFYGDKK